MKKILLLPLDGRPCNTIFPQKLFNTIEYNIVTLTDAGYKKTAANYEDIKQFLLSESKDAHGVVLSIDMLLYGGLVPGRIHNLSIQTLNEHLALIEKIKQNNNDIKIYAFQCIMRCPTYNSDDEEPDYYKFYGKQIHELGVLIDKAQQSEEQSEEKSEYEEKIEKLKNNIPSDVLDDYINRRNLNIELNMNALDLVKNDIIDFLIIPQDDAAQYGFTAINQSVVRKKIKQNNFQDKVLIYPGADEIAMTLLSKMRNYFENKTPCVYIHYASEKSKYLVPSFEDRPLCETLKYHIMAAGCRIATCAENAQLILAVNAPADNMKSFIAQDEHLPQYETQRNMAWWLNEIELFCKEGKAVSIADNAYSNAAEIALIQMLDKKNMLLKLAGYAGWNTSSNTVGTSIAQAVQYFYEGNDKRHKDFLVLRYIEDLGYCAFVRSDIIINHLQELGLDNFDLKDKKEIIGEVAKAKLEKFVKDYLSSISDDIVINKINMPWNRMFEAQIDASLKNN